MIFPGRAFALKVKGDSMETEFSEGDIIVINI
jgi:phage repressor protein C with HTH and peptisase S24 domain